WLKSECPGLRLSYGSHGLKRVYQVEAELADVQTPRDAWNSKLEAQLFDEEAHVFTKEVLDARDTYVVGVYVTDYSSVAWLQTGPSADKASAAGEIAHSPFPFLAKNFASAFDLSALAWRGPAAPPPAPCDPEPRPCVPCRSSDPAPPLKMLL